MKIVVQAFITLDGVVQAGGGPDEDREGGFAHGGWMMDYDEQMDKVDEGRKIIEEWESRTEAQYFASRTLTTVGWKNSHLLGPGVPAAVRKLRAEPGGEIRVWGTELVKTLAQHDLVDEYRLAVYPLVLGSGKKLFSDGFAPARLTLVETRALRSGVLINSYQRAEADGT
ncbi:MAG TPA: dihydrofolate reductase family protein [Vicinamibacterales bacterium]